MKDKESQQKLQMFIASEAYKFYIQQVKLVLKEEYEREIKQSESEENYEKCLEIRNKLINLK